MPTVITMSANLQEAIALMSTLAAHGLLSRDLTGWSPGRARIVVDSWLEMTANPESTLV